MRAAIASCCRISALLPADRWPIRVTTRCPSSGVSIERRLLGRCTILCCDDIEHFSDLDCAKRRVAASLQPAECSRHRPALAAFQACERRTKPMDGLRSPRRLESPTPPTTAAHLSPPSRALASPQQRTAWEASSAPLRWRRCYLALLSKGDTLFSQSNLG